MRTTSPYVASTTYPTKVFYEISSLNRTPLVYASTRHHQKHPPDSPTTSSSSGLNGYQQLAHPGIGPEAGGLCGDLALVCPLSLGGHPLQHHLLDPAATPLGKRWEMGTFDRNSTDPTVSISSSTWIKESSVQRVGPLREKRTREL